MSWAWDYTKVRYYYKPTRIIFGLGVADRVGIEAKKLALEGTALLVTDEAVSRIHGTRIRDLLEDQGFNVRVYEGVLHDPRGIDADAAWNEISKECRYGLILGLGGGSCMDTAKVMAVMATNDATCMELSMSKKIAEKPGLPCICLPTTAGTGAEVSAASVFHPGSVANIYIAPTMAIVDPNLSKTMPPSMTAQTGLDAFGHCEQGVTALRLGHPITDALSYMAIQLVAKNLIKAYYFPDDLQARYNMSAAALLGGLAVHEHGYIGGYNHAMGEGLTSKYRIGHGLAVASVLPYDMEQDVTCSAELVAEVARAMGEKVEGLTVREAAYKGVFALKKLADDVGIPPLKDLGVPRKDLLELAKFVHENTSAGTVPRLSEKTILGMFEAAWEGKLRIES